LLAFSLYKQRRGRPRGLRSSSDDSIERYGYRDDGELVGASNQAASVRFARDVRAHSCREFENGFTF
jgi:hypothetical protein